MRGEQQSPALELLRRSKSNRDSLDKSLISDKNE